MVVAEIGGRAQERLLRAHDLEWYVDAEASEQPPRPGPGRRHDLSGRRSTGARLDTDDAARARVTLDLNASHFATEHDVDATPRRLGAEGADGTARIDVSRLRFPRRHDLVEAPAWLELT